MYNAFMLLSAWALTLYLYMRVEVRRIDNEAGRNKTLQRLRNL